MVEGWSFSDKAILAKDKPSHTLLMKTLEGRGYNQPREKSSHHKPGQRF